MCGRRHARCARRRDVAQSLCRGVRASGFMLRPKRHCETVLPEPNPLGVILQTPIGAIVPPVFALLEDKSPIVATASFGQGLVLRDQIDGTQPGNRS